MARRPWPPKPLGGKPGDPFPEVPKPPSFPEVFIYEPAKGFRPEDLKFSEGPYIRRPGEGLPYSEEAAALRMAEEAKVRAKAEEGEKFWVGPKLWPWEESEEKRIEREMKMAFGKYAGMELGEVPVDYLEWMVNKCKGDLKTYQDELERRTLLEVASQSTLEKIVSAGFRELAKKAHPDAGGSPKDFLELKAAQEQLKVILQELKGSGVAGGTK